MAKANVPAKRGNTQVAQRGSNVVAPDFMKGKEGAGTEAIETKDMEMPRVRLIQGTDEEIIAAHDGMKIGHFYQSLAEVDLGPELNVVPLHISKRYVLWRPRPPVDVGGILARADDAIHWQPADKEFEVKIDKKGTKVKWKTAATVEESGLAEWGTSDPDDENSPPAAVLCHVFVVYMVDYPEYSPAVLMLQRSAIKAARKWLGKINITGGAAPIYGQVYRMTGVDDTNAGGQRYKNYSFMANGFVQDNDDFNNFEQLHEQFKKTGVKVKDESEENIPDSNGKNAAPSEAPKDKKTGKSRY